MVDKDNVSSYQYRTIYLGMYRNIGIMAHIDISKTATTKRIIYYTAKLYNIGGFHDGGGTMDLTDN